MPQKTVTVTASLGTGFAMESQLGSHTVRVDQPKEAGGTDTGPNPLQLFLLSIAGCIGAIGRITANQKKIPLRNMTIKIEGDLNTDGLLGKEIEGRVGFDQIQIVVDIDADMTTEEKESFLAEVESRCPIADNVINASSVSVKLQA